jgi:hypothetical protein
VVGVVVAGGCLELVAGGCLELVAGGCLELVAHCKSLRQPPT